MNDEDWRARLAADLLGNEDEDEPASQRATTIPFSPDAATAMEIAFGQARSELTYVLELGRSKSLPVLGSVLGDSIWIQLGEAKLAFRLDRKASIIHATIAAVDSTLAWDAKGRAITTSEGRSVDMQSYVQSAIDSTVRAYKSQPPSAV